MNNSLRETGGAQDKDRMNNSLWLEELGGAQNEQLPVVKRS